MNPMFTAVMIFVFCFGLMYIQYGKFVACVVRYAKKPVKQRIKGKVVTAPPKLTTSEKIKCYIPIWQVAVVYKAMYGYYGFTAPMSIITLALIGFNFFNSFIWYLNSYFVFFAHIGMYIAIILHIILYAIVTANCAKLYEFHGVHVVLNAICPYFACYFLMAGIPTYMADLYKEKKFEGSDGETVIKSKSNKR